MRFVVVQFSAYLTDFRRYLLQTRYGVALRNLIFVKQDKRLYFLDNLQAEHCLSHPAWTNVQSKPASFTPEAHTHPYAASDHTHPYADPAHTHPRIVGEITIWPTDTPPTHWFLCNGQAVNRLVYASLYALIGTTYGGGDGSNTFNLPDLRGRFPLGQDDMGGTPANRVTATQADNLGQGSGAESHTLTIGELPSHSHTQDAHNHIQDAHNHAIKYQSVGSNGFAAFKLASPIQETGGGTEITVATNQPTIATNQSSGGGSPHNNMPPYLTLNFIIYAGEPASP